MSDFFRETQVKRSRKAKHCSWCREMIEIGAPKVVTAGSCEGDFSIRNLHPECRVAEEKFLEPELKADGYAEYPYEIMQRGSTKPK